MCVGKNIPNDLQCEHLIRLCKTSVKSLGANKTEKCITRVARALGTISPLLSNFDRDNNVNDSSGVHKIAKADKDRRIVIDTLQKASVFRDIPNREHLSFKKPRNILHAKPRKDMIEWIENHTNFS